MSVARAQREIDSREFAEWMSYHQEVEPLGPVRADAAISILAHVLARCHGNKSSKPSDFMPTYEDERPSDAQLSAKMYALLGAPDFE